MSRVSNRTAQQLLEVTMLLMRSLAAEMRQGEHGLLPAHVGLLAKIDAGEFSLSDLAQYQSVRLPTISKSITALVERGWVERWVPERNRRQTMARLTPEGRRVLAKIKRRAESHVADLLEPLSAEERTRVNSALTSLSKALSEHTARETQGRVGHERVRSGH